MKNNAYKFYIAAVVAVYAIINILVFTIVPFDKLNNPAFWISWGFMFGLNAIVGIVLGLKIRKRHHDDIIIAPVGTFAGGNVVFFILGLIFSLVQPELNIIIATDVAAAIIYLLLVCRFILAVTFMRRNDEVRRKKVAYIRNMTAMVESYVPLADSPDMKDVIKRLADDFRYSDPMSHSSLTDKEEELLVLVTKLEEIVSSGDEAKITAKTAEINRKLRLRNSICANLK